MCADALRVLQGDLLAICPAIRSAEGFFGVGKWQDGEESEPGKTWVHFRESMHLPHPDTLRRHRSVLLAVIIRNSLQAITSCVCHRVWLGKLLIRSIYTVKVFDIQMASDVCCLQVINPKVLTCDPRPALSHPALH